MGDIATQRRTVEHSLPVGVYTKTKNNGEWRVCQTWQWKGDRGEWQWQDTKKWSLSFLIGKKESRKRGEIENEK
jgi:hypothetical protein